MTSLLYRAEKFSRSNIQNLRNHHDQEFYNFYRCKVCRSSFSEGDLRLSARVQSLKRDDKDEIWYHCDCFFTLQRPNSIDQIENFENLTNEDQMKIRASILIYQQPLVPTENANSSLKRSYPSESNVTLSDYNLHYSKSSRAECVGCRSKVMKGLIRVSKTVYFTEVGMKFGGQDFQHHLECFVAICKKDYGFYLSGDKLPGFNDLSPKDQQKVLKAFQQSADEQGEVSGVSDAKQRRLESDAGPSNFDQELENLIILQTKSFQEIREHLRTYSSIGMLSEFLKLNGSKVVSGYENVLDRCADFISFGAIIQKCTSCTNGNFIFSKHGYQCDGVQNEWAKCDKFEESPLREAVKFPKSMTSIRDELAGKGYHFDVKKRAVRPKEKIVHESKRDVKVIRQREPLYNMHVVAIGKLTMDKKELKVKIESFGGKLVTKLQERIAFVISTENEVEKLNKRMQQVQNFQIQVVDENFLDEIEGLKPEETIEKIKSLEISDWGKDPLLRIPQEEEGLEFRESIYARGVKKVENVKVKNGFAIDPDSNLDKEAHVYKKEGILYTSTLDYVNIQENKNSYFILQVLQSDDLKKYWLFQKWGRIGTKIGDKKLEEFRTAEMAVAEFHLIYRNKTDNRFDPTVKFVKKPGKFYPVDVDYEADAEKIDLNKPTKIESKYPLAVQNLVKLIFDLESMKQTMMEFQLDLSRLPLGKLSQKQLQEAHVTLSELNDLIINAADASQFKGLSNKFYTLVPHNFGMRSPPVIDTLEMIKEKREMIDSLLQIEIAYSLLQGEVDENANPIDARYEQMRTELKPLKHDSKEFRLIQSYVANTHAPTHHDYTLNVEEVFKVKREGEKDRYRPFKSLHNRQLLWHGSRLTNFAGILSNGLKIAPKEAPPTGYMFGKGIYFADMVSKSANYCFTTEHHTTGLMLLSEVALGSSLDLTNAKNITKLNDKFHSVRGLGQTFPDPEMSKKLANGVTIPMGKPVKNDKLQSSLLYNEYIVYDAAQVNIKYLLKMKFNHTKK